MNPAELTYFNRNGDYWGKSQGWQSQHDDINDVVDEVRKLRCENNLPGAPGIDLYVIVTIHGQPPRMLI